MKRTQRFKRVTNPKKTIQTTDSSSMIISTIPKSKPKSKVISQFNPVSVPQFSIKNSKILPPDFYQIDALDLAPRLLGKYLRRDDVVLQITEVEAYRPNDSACHGRFGITARTAPVFGPGGHSYVYLCYGLHTMLNVVADKEGVGAAVLIRSCAPVSGLDTIQQRRGLKTEKPVLLTGPGKVEAYRPNDSACHGRFGITARTAPVFGPGGHSYVYLCYGLHTMLNVVADKEGVGAAVLIRSCAPVSGLDTIQQRRGLKTEKPVLLTGPGKVEAYRPNDSACHGRFGITARTAPVFGPGGHSYVYLCYGLHTMLNVVADKEGVGAAVLIRSCAPVSGLDTIQQRRGLKTEKPVLLTGPGKVEAYRPNDSACHGRFGITARTAPVFGPGGHSYVYLCYGLHTMLNVVADKEGVGAAVLIRSCAPVSGLDTIQQRRGLKTEKPVLLTGPGKDLRRKLQGNNGG
ncbi:uncharacterized protein LOC132293078 isoform X2 [Cornus florida]|uniref:uncharacterized protein LOC132293078 isoform X2 n=1 Tax=Cornus florida TaxID=4283 RepID=UPI0028A0A1F3|nr:uncharacterized protein LOC132293078 isoform X2 [Cornus florida]